MLYDSATVPHLKPWLVRTLEPICDAEPGALADYILALLKHNAPEQEMRKELLVQLEEFLEKECPSFIDTLFTILRTKSYLPYTSSPSSPKHVDNGIPIPLDLITPSPVDSSTDRKRSIEVDDRGGRPPAKGPRVNADGQFSRYGNGGGRSTGHWEERDNDGRGRGYPNGAMDMYAVPVVGGMSGMAHVNGGRRPQAYQPPDQKRGICRDYHNNGYCARGAMCKYSHGDDAMVPGQLYPVAPGLPFMPMFPGAMPFGPSPGYDPHDARIDMHPRHPQRPPILPRTHQEDGGVVHASGELPVIQDLTPQISQESVAPTGPSEINQAPEQDATISGGSQFQAPPLQQMDVSYGQQAFPAMHSMPYMMVPPQVDMDMRPGNYRGGFRGRGRGRGTFGGDVHNFRPERRDDKTLVVEKIPEDKLSLANVNDWFKRFGTVTNVAIDPMSGKALVSFSTHEEAHAAWKSEDAVFNNRFVKVFWHRPMEGQGQVGARMLAASASAVAGMATKSSGGGAHATTPTPAASTAATAVRKTPTAPASATASALAAKQQLLEQQITEQKTLMSSLDGASPEEKKNIMARLRKLGEEMTASSSSTSTAPTSNTKKSISTPDIHQNKERERLDKELDLHSATAAPTSTSTSAEKKETAEELKAKLEKLKAEAVSLGLNTDAASSDWQAGASPYRGGYRGRARASRGFFRGAPRGGAPRFNMTLDNRPKKLLLKGAKSENLQAVKDWYETTGQLDSVDMLDNGDTIVAFKTRAAAEQGFAKGLKIPTVGQVQVSWQTDKQTATPSNLDSRSKSTGGNSSANQGSVRDESHMQVLEPEPEEEMVARGWGGDDEGDGMGML